MNIYRLYGMITKTKEFGEIFIIAKTRADAVVRASSFASDLRVLDERSLDAEWDRYYYYD